MPAYRRVQRRTRAGLPSERRHQMTTVSRPHIVVGIEGTNASEAALQWAVREAGLRECPLTVVHAWSFDPVRDAGKTNEHACLLYTSPSPRDRTRSRMPS